MKSLDECLLGMLEECWAGVCDSDNSMITEPLSEFYDNAGEARRDMDVLFKRLRKMLEDS